MAKLSTIRWPSWKTSHGAWRSPALLKPSEEGGNAARRAPGGFRGSGGQSLPARYHSRPVRRLGRILLNAVTTLSLSFSVAAMVLWARGYARSDHFWFESPMRADGTSRTFGVSSGRGVLCPLLINGQPRRSGAVVMPGWHWATYDDAGLEGSTVFRRVRPSIKLGVGTFTDADLLLEGRGVVAPAWLFAIVFSALPLVRGIALYRRRPRLKAGHCASCGYDLRATPGRCPECGGVVGESSGS